MNAHTPFPLDPATPGAGDSAAERVARARVVALRQMALLDRLAEAGLALALAVEREAQACTDKAHAPEPCGEPRDLEPPARAGRSLQGLALAYARAARAVRMTVALQSRVLRELEAVERQAGFSGPSDAREREAVAQDRKARVARIVRRVAEAQALDQEAGEALRLDGIERFDDDVYGDVLTCPMGEIVARICADLGLDPDWSRLAEEAWAQAEMADPRSPFAASGRAYDAQEDLATRRINPSFGCAAGQDCDGAWSHPP